MALADQSSRAADRQSGRVQPGTNAARFSAERLFAELPAGRIAYVDRGRGPGALFLHGFPVNGYQWRGALDRLSGHRRCIVPDFMGLGYSEPRAGQDLHPVAQAEMVIALLDRLSIKTVDVVANDSGCAVAQLLIARNGPRVRSLLLTNGDTEPDCPPQAVQEGVIPAAKAGVFADTFKRWVDDKALCRQKGQLGGDTFTFPDKLRDETIDMYLRPLAANPDRTNAYGRAAEGNSLTGISSALKAAEIPVRIIWGTGDWIFKPQMADYLDKLFPRSRGVRRVEGAKLFFPEEYPDLIAHELRQLWAV
jgi:pimeloyl-ACP methyl ester carboxylesterase